LWIISALSRIESVNPPGGDDAFLAALSEFLGCPGDVLRGGVGDDRRDGRADTRENAHPDADHGGAQHVPSVDDIVTQRDEDPGHAGPDMFGSLLDVDGVREHLGQGEDADDHGQAVEASLHRVEPESQPGHAGRLVDARHRHEHAE
jgi:hypothetical protein